MERRVWGVQVFGAGAKCRRAKYFDQIAGLKMVKQRMDAQALTCRWRRKPSHGYKKRVRGHFKKAHERGFGGGGFWVLVVFRRGHQQGADGVGSIQGEHVPGG